jgi:two-component system chemotaxis response regulator CheB
MLPVSPELRLEIEIAAGERVGSARLIGGAELAPFTCPNCGAVLSQLEARHPLRFRCQVGHAYTADALGKEQEGGVDEALRVALRIIEGRAELVHRMAENGRQNGRVAVARMYGARAAEYREYGDMIRHVMLKSLDPELPKPEGQVGSCQ